MAIKASVVSSPVVKARVGQQNVTRVLSSAASASASGSIIQAPDLDSSRKSEDGLVLVWDAPTQKFVLTNRIDALSIEFVYALSSSFLNVSNDLTASRNLLVSGISTLTDLIVSNNSTLNGNLSVSGTSTLVDLNLSNNLTVNNDLNVSGISTFASLNTSNDLTVSRNLLVSGISTLNTLSVNGLTTLDDDVQINSDLSLTGKIIPDSGMCYVSSNFSGPNGIAFFNSDGLLKSSPDTTQNINTSNYILTTQLIAGTDTPVWTTTIDGGEY